MRLSVSSNKLLLLHKSSTRPTPQLTSCRPTKREVGEDCSCGVRGLASNVKHYETAHATCMLWVTQWVV
jgi:hypothetical protein